MMLLAKLCALTAFVALLAHLGGWRSPLPRVVAETLSWRKPAGHAADDSESDSGESAPGERSVGDGALVVSDADSWASTDRPERPGLVERWTTWLERWSTGAPATVLETPAPERTDREAQRAALVEHLLRERARIPALPATRIVESAADQPDVPWGRVSRATVWRVWRELP